MHVSGEPAESFSQSVCKPLLIWPASGTLALYFTSSRKHTKDYDLALGFIDQRTLMDAVHACMRDNVILLKIS